VQIFKKVNEFVRVAIKFKDTITPSLLKDIRRLGKTVGIKFGNQELEMGYLKSKEFYMNCKSKLLTMINKLIHPNNLPTVSSFLKKKQCSYKFWVEP